jgi:arylsulfatase A-like enzyme/Tfp pilus assembly protein PilF
MMLLIGTVACTKGTPPAPPAPNIILITIDTLRADRIGPDLTPAIDALASRGVRFTHARSAVPLTLPSHVSIMTGSLPPANGVRLNGTTTFTGRRATLAHVLRDGGYRTGAFVGAYVLDRRFGLSDGFDVYDDHVQRDSSGSQQLEAERRGNVVVDAALKWLSTPDNRPLFAWIHLYDPHAPYDPPAEYLAKAANNPYDGEVAFADAQVARVLDWLRSSGRTSNTVVAVAGDHGEGLGEHGELTHGMLTYDSTLRVPLVLTAPSVSSPSTIDANVSLIDLAGTLLQLAHRDVPETMSRALLLAAQATPRDVYAETEYPRTAGWHPLAALVYEHWKLIASSENELYDIDADPGERQNLAITKDSLVQGMRRRVRELAPADRAEGSAAVPADAAERLRALGYVSGGAAPATGNEPNPARQIHPWNTFERELSRLTSGQARFALPGLANLARTFPDAPVFQSTYARALKDTGRVREAVDVYRRAVARWPKDATLYHDLAVAAGAAGLAPEAIRAEQAALALEPGNAAASNGLGLLQIQDGKPADAVKAFEHAVKSDPTNATFWTNLGNARRDSNDLVGAQQAYLKALEADPRSSDAANGIGVVLVQGHRASEAVPWFERALAGSPGFAEARLNLGIAYQESGNAAKAAEQYRRVLDSSPTGSREYQAAAKLLKTLG